MTTDKFTKLLLAAIATALWLIALNPWIQPIPVAAQSEFYLSLIQSDVSQIQNRVRQMATGVCTNSKIC